MKVDQSSDWRPDSLWFVSQLVQWLLCGWSTGSRTICCSGIGLKTSWNCWTALTEDSVSGEEEHSWCSLCCLLFQWLSQHTWENVPSILCLSHLCLCLSNLMNCWMTLTSLPCQYWGVLDQIWGSCDFGVSLSGTQQQHTHYQVRFKWAHTDIHTLDTYLHSL